ncbi:hypothetical protein SAMN04487981_12928 [Streptomyces sp. cf386]|uniref:hypothetical protein n=1 Tax=Streptomyces sp. cf386 TaxID=1761904 RepID=UPI000889EB55|nr:hypothetical protein SAMN04487981_12928 [Streptomyces sp. cf386]
MSPAGCPGRSAGASVQHQPGRVDLYTVGVHWALADVGTSLDAGNLRPEQFPTPERKARLGTDMARAWWAWQVALLDAYRASPGEARDASRTGCPESSGA